MIMIKAEIRIVMGSESDWAVMKEASALLKEMNIPHESVVYSAHRTPEELFSYMEEAEQNGTRIYIAAAGMAAHLPGVMASKTILPILGVPMASGALQGVDALLSIVQMPPGIPVGTLGIGASGAKNAALLAVSILALENATYSEKLREFRKKQKEKVLSARLT